MLPSSLKRWCPTTSLHGVITQKTTTRIFIAVNISSHESDVASCIVVSERIRLTVLKLGHQTDDITFSGLGNHKLKTKLVVVKETFKTFVQMSKTRIYFSITLLKKRT